MLKLKILFLVLLFAAFGKAKAQYYGMPAEYQFSLLTEKKLAADDSSIHTGIKPYIHFFSDKYILVPDSYRLFKFIKNDPALDVCFFKHLIRVEPKKEKIKLQLDPLINFERGRDFADDRKFSVYTNTRGFIGSGYVGDNVYFESMFTENQAFVPEYLRRNYNDTKVVPGQGRWKTFKDVGYDYAFSSGFFSVQVSKNFNIQAGHGKQKIGNGYRSLLLSDNSFNYPYARFTHQWFKGKVQYSNIYAVLMNLVPSSEKRALSTERLFQKKAASFHYLSIKMGKSLQLGLFQGLVWAAGDNRNRHDLNWRYFNPVVFTSLINQQLNDKNNFLIGGTAKLKISKQVSLYGQCMADDLSGKDTLGKGWGYQTGITYFDALGVKNLFFQAEFNFVTEGAYVNKNSAGTDQAYSHYGQNLAFTPGKGQELLFVADYKVKRWFLNLRYNYQDVPLNSKTHFINNIFNARLGYVINPAYNLNICAGYIYRNQNFYNFRTLNNETSYFFVGLRTSLYNFYYDF